MCSPKSRMVGQSYFLWRTLSFKIAHTENPAGRLKLNASPRYSDSSSESMTLMRFGRFLVVPPFPNPPCINLNSFLLMITLQRTGNTIVSFQKTQSLDSREFYEFPNSVRYGSTVYFANWNVACATSSAVYSCRSVIRGRPRTPITMTESP